MKRKYAVIGLGNFGSNLSIALTDRGAEVLGIDNSESHIEKLRDRIAHAVIADCRDLRSLQSLGLEDLDGVVVAIGEDFESSMLATANLQEIGVKRIINRVVSPVHEKLLHTMKIEELFLPELEAAETMANRLTMSGVVGCLQLTDDYSILEVKAPPAFVGKTVGDVDLRRKYNLNLVTVIRKTKDEKALMTLGQRRPLEVLGVPDASFVFSKDDILVLFGKETDVESLPS